MIDMADIADTVSAYLLRYPDDRPRLAPLLASIDDKAAITHRTTFTGHVTCSVVLMDSSWRVLHIRHNGLGAWLRPGGHLEPADATLCDAALRELHEETGIPAGLVSPLDDHMPIDIDVHAIPANPNKPEPEHLHFDLRHAFTLRESAGPLSLQAEEVSGYRWLPSEFITPESLRGRLARLRG